MSASLFVLLFFFYVSYLSRMQLEQFRCSGRDKVHRRSLERKLRLPPLARVSSLRERAVGLEKAARVLRVMRAEEDRILCSLRTLILLVTPCLVAHCRCASFRHFPREKITVESGRLTRLPLPFLNESADGRDFTITRSCNTRGSATL